MGIRKTINKDKPDFETTVVRNQEATLVIPAGSPVIFKCDGTALDGIGVVLPSSSSATKATSLFAGVLMRTCAPGDIAEAAINGFILNGLYSRGTRAATTAAWSTFPAIGLGDVLVIDSTANAWIFTAVGALSAGTPLAVCADAGMSTVNSATTQASNFYTQWSAATAATVAMKMIIRNM